MGSAEPVADPRRLALLADASSLLAVGLDYDTVVQRIADLMVQSFADWCTVDIVDPDGALQRRAVAAKGSKDGLAFDVAASPVQVSPGHPAAHTMATGEGLLIPVVTEEILRQIAHGEEHLALLRRMPPGSAVIAPLIARGRLIGVLQLLSSAARQQPYDKPDLRLAEEVAAHAALAIDNAGLFADVQEAQARYRRLVDRLEVNDKARTALNQVFIEERSLADTAHEILRVLCATLGWDLAALWSVDDNSDMLHCVDLYTPHGFAPSFSELTKRTTFPRGIGLPGRVWAAEAPAWIEELTLDQNFPRSATALRDGLHSGAAFPITAGGSLIGVIEFFTRASRPRDNELVAFIETVGANIGQYIRRRAGDEALRISEGRARAVVDAALDSIVSIDHEGRLTEFNPAAERTFGYTRDEVLGRPMVDLIIPPNLRASHAEGFARYMATREPHILGRRMEFQAMRADGATFPIELTIVRADVPGPPVFTAYIRDLSQSKMAQRRRQVQYEVTRILTGVDSLSEAAPRLLRALCTALEFDVGTLWVVDRLADALRCVEVFAEPDLDIEEFERISRDMLFDHGVGTPGIVWDQGHPVTVFDFGATVHPRAPSIARAGLRGLIAYPIKNVDETVGVIEFYRRSEQEHDEDLLGLIGSAAGQVGQFIVRGWAEEENRFHSALLRSQHEATIDGIVVVSPHGKILSVNNRFLEMWDIPASGAADPDERLYLSRVREQVVDPDAFVDLLLRNHADMEASVRTEVSLLDGRVFDMYTTPLRHKDSVYGRAYYYRDISEEKRTERILAESGARFAFLAEASTVLVGSLDPTVTLGNLARLCAPYLADWCVIDLLENDGSLRRIAVSHDDADRQGTPECLEIPAHYGRDKDARHGVLHVLRTGKPEAIEQIPDHWLADVVGGAQDGTVALKQLGFRSYMCVPLIARGRILGAMTFITAGSGRTLGKEDLALGEDLARRAALAVDNARLYRERSDVARTLQDSLLPPALPTIPGFEVGARYHPAGEALDVGGDFYDYFARGTDDWAIVIGDVCGKGADAAALTALARYTIRAAAMQTARPAKVLAMLNEAVLRQSQDERFVTVAYARIRKNRQGRRTVTVATGGHPLPVLLRAGGSVERIGEPGSLIGLFPDPILIEQSVILEPGDAIVMFTDGVTEARRGDEMFGEERVVDLIGTLGGMDAPSLAMAVERAAVEFQDGGSRDDIAVVAIRLTGDTLQAGASGVSTTQVLSGGERAGR